MVVDLISQNSDTSNPVPLVFYWLVQCEETIRTSARRRVLLILLHVCSPPAPPSLPAPPGGLKGVLLQIQVHAGEKALPAVLCCFRDVWNVPVGPKRHIEVVSCCPPPPPRERMLLAIRPPFSLHPFVRFLLPPNVLLWFGLRGGRGTGLLLFLSCRFRGQTHERTEGRTADPNRISCDGSWFLNELKVSYPSVCSEAWRWEYYALKQLQTLSWIAGLD